VTPAEITILRSLAEAEVVTFMAEGHTAAALARFEDILESLREIQKAGWFELEVGEGPAEPFEKARDRGLVLSNRSAIPRLRYSPTDMPSWRAAWRASRASPWRQCFVGCTSPST
jgi:hypothetical protein